MNRRSTVTASLLLFTFAFSVAFGVVLTQPEESGALECAPCNCFAGGCYGSIGPHTNWICQPSTRVQCYMANEPPWFPEYVPPYCGAHCPY